MKANYEKATNTFIETFNECVGNEETRKKKILESYKNNPEILDTCKRIADVCTKSVLPKSTPIDNT